MKTELNIVRKNFGEALPVLQLKLRGYMSRWGRIYIGTTTDYDARSRKHEVNGWEKLVVLYNAFAPHLAAAMERELIAYVRNSNFEVECMNIAPGGEGVRPDNSHFIYVLVAEPRNRGGAW